MKNKMRIFISVGMKGRTDEEIQKDVNDAKEILEQYYARDFDLEIVDNFIEKPENETRRLYCLGEAIKTIGECDAVYFVEGWSNYNGCWVEHSVCDFYNIPVLYKHSNGRLRME